MSEYFCFSLQTEKYLLPLPFIREVLTLSLNDLCAIPGVHPALLGVTNQRGKILWVLDLAFLLTQNPLEPPSLLHDTVKVILCQTKERSIGCLVSTLHGILEIEDIPPSNSSPSPYIQTIIPYPDSPLTLLNGESLLTTIKNN